MIDEARVLMAEAVVILPPYMAREQVVERRDRSPPRDLGRHLQTLGALVEHRVDDVDDRLVTSEKAVPAGQQIALEPTLTEVLGEHLHDAAVLREVGIARLRRCAPAEW